MRSMHLAGELLLQLLEAGGLGVVLGGGRIGGGVATTPPPGVEALVLLPLAADAGGNGESTSAGEDEMAGRSAIISSHSSVEAAALRARRRSSLSNAARSSRRSSTDSHFASFGCSSRRRGASMPRRMVGMPSTASSQRQPRAPRRPSSVERRKPDPAEDSRPPTLAAETKKAIARPEEASGNHRVK